MRSLVLAFVCVAAFAEDGKLIFQKSFPGSTPPWVKASTACRGSTSASTAR